LRLKDMNADDWGILRGWKEIRDACGLKCSTQTMRRLARKYPMPIYYMNNRPTALKSMMRAYWLKVSEIVLRRGKKTDSS
jgi:hypothetical protein